eukprot:TRINITY_DN1186_c0_g1_i1.p1 TRINITY_DN1186_c0_g1~~TRINITY_DN1186_c0_g1_i1.p1  ORF type:complete len:211 (-),score=26.78 TRINITY_DN1186_c0_g1_i1:38-670(-)
MLLWVTLLALSAIGYCTTGVDVSSPISTSAWQCLRGQGKSFAVVRAYQSNGVVDPNGAQTIKNAHAAGFPYVDAYIFPCVPCGNPAGQVATMVNHLRSSGAIFGMVWYDIERQSWSSNLASNQQFITAMINQGRAMNVSAGVYTNYYNWEAIAGLGWTGASHLPLWYAHYDNNPSFSDFQAFGGWTKPNIKQYQGTTSECGVGVDLNWYP